MKTRYWTILTLALMCFSFQFASAVNSPMSKGSLVVGGGATFMSISPDNEWSDQNVTVVIFYPSFGYFVADRLCLGTSLLVGSADWGDESIGVMAIGPQITYYFASSQRLQNYSGRAIPYVTVSALLGQVSNESDEITGSAITFGGGITAMMAKNIGGFFELNYNIDKISESDDSSFDFGSEDDYNGSRFGIQLGLRLFIW